MSTGIFQGATSAKRLNRLNQIEFEHRIPGGELPASGDWVDVLILNGQHLLDAAFFGGDNGGLSSVRLIVDDVEFVERSPRSQNYQTIIGACGNGDYDYLYVNADPGPLFINSKLVVQVRANKSGAYQAKVKVRYSAVTVENLE